MKFAYIAVIPLQLSKIVPLDHEIRGKNLGIRSLQQMMREASGGAASALSKQHEREDIP